jgi:hypothetical protein
MKVSEQQNSLQTLLIDLQRFVAAAEQNKTCVSVHPYVEQLKDILIRHLQFKEINYK